MTIPEFQKTIALQCYDQRGRKVEPLEEALKQYLEAPLAWVVPLDLYRINYDESRRINVNPSDLLPAGVAAFATHLHTRGRRVLTLEDFQQLHKASDDISREIFQSRASQLNIRLFRPHGVRAFKHLLIPDPKGIDRQAYRMTASQWIVINGAATRDDAARAGFVMKPDGTAQGFGKTLKIVTDDEVDWGIFDER